MEKMTSVNTMKINESEMVDWTMVTWNVLGDSLTDTSNPHSEKKYYDYIQENLHIKKINDYGISGSTIGTNSEPMSERYVTMADDADLITVFGGLNDYGRNHPLGDLGDTENDTYYGALDVLLKGLVEKYPDKKIGFISMYARTATPPTNSLGVPDYAYVNAGLEVCEHYGIKHLNLYEIASLNLSSTEGSAYKSDRSHLNDQGQEHLAKIIERFIKSLY
ncbi:SGNH/GDSL hydrolase family protein [Listeria rustica]|uniref:SGNH/GDSL hydrolase family protein n=1 Tax=Listeria rustica TaxID=2713503 RepID=A0A7W1T759_9LIST|nr:SGNH/GDSL hydrolase family protein [Listeria rustica]MBA3926752.1 SGNH/GDSL hydrolase family protein [Listeria rustica]